jgi:hypothetical protein
MYHRVLLLTLFPLFAVALNSPDLIRGIDQAQTSREEKLTAYSVTETYKLHNARFTETAEMVVNVAYKRGAGKTYQVVSRTGPSFLQTGVLDKMLKEEAELSRGKTRESALVTSANYQMKPLGQQVLEGRTCEMIDLTPRKKSAHLLLGKAWVDARTHNLIRIEGKPTASPSFWAGSPKVIRDYAEIEGFSFAIRTHATSQSFLLGKSELSIEYNNYHVDHPETTNTIQ